MPPTGLADGFGLEEVALPHAMRIHPGNVVPRFASDGVTQDSAALAGATRRVCGCGPNQPHQLIGEENKIKSLATVFCQ